MSDYNIEIHRGAARELSSAPRDEIERIKNKIESMVTNEWRDLSDYDVKQLSDADNDLYRFRVGDWRVVFGFDEDTKKIGIFGAGKRDTVYRDVNTFDDRADDYMTTQQPNGDCTDRVKIVNK